MKKEYQSGFKFDSDSDDQGKEFGLKPLPPIQGFPELRWHAKRPFQATSHYPAQIRESYGTQNNGWRNKIFWGDNLQVMSHMLKKWRGKITLTYIDPPYDSKADYRKTIRAKAGTTTSSQTVFEEKQYTDIWTNDEYLQFMYERLILIRELLSEDGSVFVHCDWHRAHHIRAILDEVFGPKNFINEIIWCYHGPGSPGMRQFNRKHDNILWYGKSGNWKFNADAVRVPHDEKTVGNFREGLRGSGFIDGDYEIPEGKIPEDWWVMAIAGRYPKDGKKRVGYPTEKPLPLIERIIQAASSEGDLVFDCFMGSGTTQVAAMRLGRRFIGADINLGAVQETTKRLLRVAEALLQEEGNQLRLRPDGGTSPDLYTGFEVYNVNHYDVFRNPIVAKDLLIEALELQKLTAGSLFDGEKDGRMVKIMPVNRIATRQDLNEIVSNLNYREYERRLAQNPNEPVERIVLVCMGHEPDLKAALEHEVEPYRIDVEVVDVLRDKQDLQFNRDSEARIVVRNGELIIEQFYPMNLLQKLSLQKESVEDWRELVESVMVDWNYDGAVLEPVVVDVPEKDELVDGRYPVPEGAGTIRVKITDLLSESLEQEVAHG